MERPRVDVEAVAFDLLTALIDSWSLWSRVAGDDDVGPAGRRASLRLVTTAGAYRPYEQLVREAAAVVGLPPERAAELLARWGELEPWPEVPDVLTRLLRRRLAVITNCSQRLAEIAAEATGGSFEVVMSAERAGAYKTDARAYRAGLTALGLRPERVLFVAGSAHDVPGAGAVGMPVSGRIASACPSPRGRRPSSTRPTSGTCPTCSPELQTRSAPTMTHHRR